MSNYHEYKEQEILNRVYDETNNALTVKEDSTTPLTAVNPSLVISNDDSAVSTTKTLTKTIGSTSYTKTISYNAAGDVIIVSAWS